MLSSCVDLSHYRNFAVTSCVDLSFLVIRQNLMLRKRLDFMDEIINNKGEKRDNTKIKLFYSKSIASKLWKASIMGRYNKDAISLRVIVSSPICR